MKSRDIHIRALSQEIPQPSIIQISFKFPRGQWVDSWWPSDVIWRQGSRSTLAQVMAWCRQAPSHYLNQCWLMISEVLWHSPDYWMCFRYGVKLAIDQTLLGEASSLEELQEYMEEYDKTCYFGCDNDPEWQQAIVNNTPTLFSLGHNPIQVG